MNQAPSAIANPTTPTIPGAAAAAAVDRTGFDIGWDHAHHGLVPPAGMLHPEVSVCQGWMAAKAVFGRRTLGSTRHTRLWMQLRLQAWRSGMAFDTLQVTPNYLAQIDTPLCPVRRVPLGGAAGHPDAAVVERLNPEAGYAAGNLVVMSALAAQARAGHDVLQTLRRARQADDSTKSLTGMDGAAWLRLAALRAFATPLPFAQAAAFPLAVLPPNRVRVLNAVQGLQALVTQCFAAPGWSARCRALAQSLPAHTLRHDFNLFVGAMAPRVLEAGPGARALRHALEDAWRQERVQRRWQHLVLSLGEAGTESLLQRAAQLPQPGLRIECHEPAQATEGWQLAASPAPPLPLTRRRGLAAGRAERSLRLAAPPADRPGTTRPPSAPATRA